MSFKTELHKPWKAPRFAPPPEDALRRVADDLQRRFGRVPPDPKPRPDLLAETERRLREGRGGLSGLERRHLRAVPWLLHQDAPWWGDARFVDSYLDWVGANWISAPRRLWRHHLLSLQPGSVASERLAPWLGARRVALRRPLREFSERRHLFEPQRAVEDLAGSLLGDGNILGEMDALGLRRSDLIRSALMLSALAALGEKLRGYRGNTPIAKTLKDLLADLGETPTYGMPGPQALKDRALKSLVEGLVAWAAGRGGGPSDEAARHTLDLLHFLIGDPRLHEARWVRIDEKTRTTVESWLTHITLGSFFQVFLELGTDRQDMVREREAFWSRYIDKDRISRAWLITGDRGVPLAKTLLGQSFGRFERGQKAQSDHLGLLLQLGNYVVLEMNKTGSTLFWPVSDAGRPDFYKPEYSRAELLNSCNGPPGQGSRFRLTHQGDWQRRYENEILRRTGIRPG